MKAAIAGVNISPVNMEERKNLGIKAGDTIRVHQKIQDKGKTRIQIFEGLVLARKHGTEPGATFTVRKVASGVGVEKIYPLYSPMIDKLEIVKRSKVRRSKLYFIREKVAREIKRQMRRMSLATLTTESGIEAEARVAAEAKQAEEAAAAAEAEAAKKAEEEEAQAAETAQAEETPVEPTTSSEEESSEPEADKEAAPETAEAVAEETPVAEEKVEETEEEKKD